MSVAGVKEGGLEGKLLQAVWIAEHHHNPEVKKEYIAKAEKLIAKLEKKRH